MQWSPSGPVIKATHPGKYGAVLGVRLEWTDEGWQEQVSTLHATPREYLDRLELSRALLGDTVQLQGVARTPEGLSIVTRQKPVVGKPATFDQVNEAMCNANFELIHEDGVWLRDETLVWDMVGNAVIGDDAIMHVFDAMLMRSTARLLSLIKSGSRRK